MTKQQQDRPEARRARAKRVKPAHQVQLRIYGAERAVEKMRAYDAVRTKMRDPTEP